MTGLFERTQQSLIKRKENIENGNINSIPSPFRRFMNDFLGLEQGCYTCITSFTKGGKTQFTLFLLFEALMFILDHPDAANMKVFYFALEESDERILQRFESYLLFKLDRIRISPRDLRSSDNNKPVPQEILDLLASEKYQIYIRAFEEHFVFSSVSNPTGIYKQCKTYAEDTGKTYCQKIQIRNEFGELEEKDGVFDHYTQNNPNEFRFIVCDHISLITSEKGMSIKESMDKLSKYFVELRNRYNFSPIVIQQQSTTNESNDSFKLKNIRPSGRGLADSTYIQRDRPKNI
jgi:replicative DNA helicase